MGRAARNVRGRALLYADRVTDSMRAAMEETHRRRELQQRYNEENGITPETILKPIEESYLLALSVAAADYVDVPLEEEPAPPGVDLARFASMKDFDREIRALEKKMKKAAESLDFESAAELRDRVAWLRRHAVFS